MELTDYLLIAGIVMLGLILLIQAFMAYVLTFAIRRMEDLDEYEREMTQRFNEELGGAIWFVLRMGQLAGLFFILWLIIQAIDWL